jgi:hypothetical protein
MFPLARRVCPASGGSNYFHGIPGEEPAPAPSAPGCPLRLRYVARRASDGCHTSSTYQPTISCASTQHGQIPHRHCGRYPGLADKLETSMRNCRAYGQLVSFSQVEQGGSSGRRRPCRTGRLEASGTNEKNPRSALGPRSQRPRTGTGGHQGSLAVQMNRRSPAFRLMQLE